jgi:glycine/D-amino acid oxidase-like deaminating enzyme/nitrite reductase/ring-hydroxylating ferredoxin subunit
MIHTTDPTIPLWADEALPALPPITNDASVDICVIGGGITGLTTAYLLARRGHSVAVLEAGAIGGGETGRTTAHLASAVDDRFQYIEGIHGEKGSRLVAESHATAIDQIEAIVQREQIQCDFKRLDGYLFLPENEKSTKHLEKECAAAQRAGLTSTTFLPEGADVGFDIGPCVRFRNQGQFHPMKYLRGLAQAVERLGGRVYCGSRVEHVEGGADAYVRTAGGVVVLARNVVMATNSPFNNRVVVHTKVASYRTYALGLRIARGTIATALYWDTFDPYHYVRLAVGSDDSAHDTLVVGGEDHKTGQENQPALCFQRLEDWARRRFPAAEQVVAHWSGQIVEPVDGVAFIGRNPMDKDNVYIATGDSGMGMTHGTIAGMLITDLIEGTENPWAALYDPSRKSLRTLWTFTKENANTAAQYTDWLTGSDVDSLDEIKSNSGAVVRKGLTKIAVYRDDRGELHQCSAVCPHLGGIVAWNAVEHSWDCPCHGSRFDAFGKRLNGPAASDLPATSSLNLLEPVVA